MKFAIITHVPHGIMNEKYFAYAPYVREMNVWSKFVDEFIIVAPLELKEKTQISVDYDITNIDFVAINHFNLMGFKSKWNAIFKIPKIVFSIYKVMKKADHIHLRCPGNIGLLGCFLQIFFPKTPKTAKYAGNWDPKAKQPLSYKIQKWILSNTLFTKNMQVLVYGEWANQSKNIKPFFTATYLETDKISIEDKVFTKDIRFVFVGTLSPGKQPIYAVKLVQELSKKYKNITLTILGEGQQRNDLQKYIDENELKNIVFLRGNLPLNVIKMAYIDSHFVILPSKSEGWPKVVAEGMFWKCLPIATQVSCVSNMLDDGNRGLLLTMNLNEDVSKIHALISNQGLYNKKAQLAMNWSRNFTIDFFEQEIEKLILNKKSC